MKTKVCKVCGGAYSENAVNADSIYKNEYLAVTGTIIDVGQDLVTKAPCISLDTANGGICLYPIQCFSQRTEIRKNKSLLCQMETLSLFMGNAAVFPLPKCS